MMSEQLGKEQAATRIAWEQGSDGGYRTWLPSHTCMERLSKTGRQHRRMCLAGSCGRQRRRAPPATLTLVCHLEPAPVQLLRSQLAGGARRRACVGRWPTQLLLWVGRRWRLAVRRCRRRREHRPHVGAHRGEELLLPPTPGVRHGA